MSALYEIECIQIFLPGHAIKNINFKRNKCQINLSPKIFLNIVYKNWVPC